MFHFAITSFSLLRTSCMLLMCVIGFLRVDARTDVTNKYLTNADFSSGPVTTVDITALTMHVVDDVVCGFQDVEGWITYIVKEDPENVNDGMAGAVMSYGSTNKIGNGVCAPSVGPNNSNGNCLGFLAVWSKGGYYYQDVTLPAGKYTLSIPVYNAQNTRAYESYIGFIPDNGTPMVISETPAVGIWTTLTTSFTLIEETSGKIALGYVSTGEGTLAAPHLFFDCVLLEYEEWVDCTSYIQNPGFDEDISFNINGEANKAVSFAYEWSGEPKNPRHALVYKASDGSIYSKDKNGEQGHNAAGEPNWDGFKTTIRGWETTNKSDTAIWIYYGSIPYALNPGMMLLGEDGISNDVIEKPTAIDIENNTGVLFLKAGWQNQCTYKQTVKGLPQAKYYLSYYIRNTNVAKSRLYADATNLCNVTCNGVSFVDNEGFNSDGWIKHSIEFIPVDSFSVEFGCRASNDYSYNNPILWVDGIELHRIGIASEYEVDAAYSSLIVKADSLVEVMHFASDRRELQAAITDFKNSKDYVALNQAILAAEVSENKYWEIMDEEGLLRNVSLVLATDEYGAAKAIVQFAYDKTIEWLTSDNASYIDSDNYIAKLNAYANIYATIYMEAEQFIASVEEAQATYIRSLMESQKTSLIASTLLDVTVVEEYEQTLRKAMKIKDQTLSLTTLPEMTYGDASYSLPSKTNEGLSLTWKCSNTLVATISDNILTVNNAGTVTITTSQVGNESYKSFSRTFTLTVNKAPLTVTANDCTKKQGEDNPTLTVIYSGFKNGDTESSLITLPTIITTSSKDSEVGTYPITVSGAASNNYTFTYVSGTLTVVANIPPEPLFGDLNSDGKVDIADVTVLLNIILGKTEQQ